MKNGTQGKNTLKFWLFLWGLGLAGQLCWNMENQWFNTFVYAKIAKDPTIISWMAGVSAAATTFSTFFFGTVADRRGRRKRVIALGYIIWGVFTIVFGLTQYITGGRPGAVGTVIVAAGFAAVTADAVMSFFGSMGNDCGYNAWANDMMTEGNRGQIGAAMATQPVIGTIVGTVAGGMLVGADDNYMRLFTVMGGAVIVLGVLALLFMEDSPGLKPNVTGSFWSQFLSAFNFKRYFAMKELVWVNLTLSVFFIAFNVCFTHIGNYMIYYLGFTADIMGIIEGVALILAMVTVIPGTKLINRDKAPLICGVSVVLFCMGTLTLAMFVHPDTVDVTTALNPVLLIGVFLIGSGYILILQALTVWSKQLYPQEARGQFEGIRILFYVLIPMIVGPAVANPIIKASGEYIDEYGFTAYLPTNTLFFVGSVIVLLTFIPLFVSKKYHDARLKSGK